LGFLTSFSQGAFFFARTGLAWFMLPGNKKIRVAVIFGGRSAEHEISVESARNVRDAMDASRFEPVLVGIGKDGRWRLAGGFSGGGRPSAVIPETGGSLFVLPAGDGAAGGAAVPLAVDAAFPVLHGPFGEDGTVQGLLKLAGIPFVGSGVLASAAGMDKDVMKRLFRDAGIPVGPFRSLYRHRPLPSFAEITAELGCPVFVKPANMGSSVGISRAGSEAEFAAAAAEAFRYDAKIVVEQLIPGREIECAVLGNESPRASVPGEVIPRHDFYSYDAKYLDSAGADLEIPARIDDAAAERIRALAVKAFETLGCEGLARVDFFLRNDGEILVNEINTMPGFTKISMYPKMWEASGIGYTDLITGLLHLAAERFARERELCTTR